MSLLAHQKTSALTPLVSVAVTAYNRETTIAATLESILQQDVTFPVEIVVGDDGSTDGTEEIVRGFVQAYPGVVRHQRRLQNLGMQRNYYQTFSECRGKYTALLDGDDYWTDPTKLQVQVDAMEKDASIAVAAHYVRWVTHTGQVAREKYPAFAPGHYQLSDVLERCFLPSPSVMFRSDLYRKLPEWYLDAAPLGDWPIYLMAAQRGSIFLMDGIFADYRLNPNGTMWGRGEEFWYRTDIRFYKYALGNLPKTFHRTALLEQGRRYQRLSYFLKQKGETGEAFASAWQACVVPHLLDDVAPKLKTLLSAGVHHALTLCNMSRINANRPASNSAGPGSESNHAQL
jgi:glycosyltransferase involved in cell wall biosynthesis